jgi:hypothetical protein
LGVNDDEQIWAGIERRLSAVEPLLPTARRWRAPEDPEATATFRIVAGPAFRRDRPAYRPVPVAAAAVIAILVGMAIVITQLPRPGIGTAPKPDAEPDHSSGRERHARRI